MDRNEFLTSFKNLLEKPALDLSLSSKLSDIEGWDSIAVLNFIAFIDETFGVSISHSLVIKRVRVQGYYQEARDDSQVV